MPTRRNHVRAIAPGRPLLDLPQPGRISLPLREATLISFPFAEGAADQELSLLDQQVAPQWYDTCRGIELSIDFLCTLAPRR
jgi:hypothetical protein